jgi:hypothetical protein
VKPWRTFVWPCVISGSSISIGSSSVTTESSVVFITWSSE